MELCTSQAISNNLPQISRRHNNHQFVTLNSIRSCSSIVSLPLKQQSSRPLFSGLRIHTRLVPRAGSDDEPNQYIDERDGVATLEDAPPTQKTYGESFSAEQREENSAKDDQAQSFEFLDNLNIKVDSENSYSLLVYGGGALVALYLASAVVSSIDTIPLIPKLMEVVGLSYSFWFTTRYLLFKKNRAELSTKIEELKQQILGSNDD